MSWSNRLAFFIVVSFLLFTFSAGYAAQWKAVFGGKAGTPKLNVPVNSLPALPMLPPLTVQNQLTP